MSDQNRTPDKSPEQQKNERNKPMQPGQQNQQRSEGERSGSGRTDPLS